MIQRIQSIYMALAALISSTLTYVTILECVTNSGTYILKMKGIYNSHTWAESSLMETKILLIFIILTILIPLFAISQFKKRKNQLKLIITSIVINITIFGSLLLFAKSIFNSLQLEGAISYSIFILFPIFATIFLTLAYIAVKKDEDLIKSLNRIR